MPIDIDDGPASGPSVKIPNVGDYITFAVIDTEVVPWIEFGTQVAKIGNDGKPRTQDLIHALVVDGGSAYVRDDDGTFEVRGEKHSHPATGTVVRLYLAGHHRWEYIQAKKKLGKLQVGDVGKWTVERFEASSKGGNNDKKVTSFGLRHPKPGEETQTAECERLHLERRAAPRTTLEPASVGASSPEWDEEPF